MRPVGTTFPAETEKLAVNEASSAPRRFSHLGFALGAIAAAVAGAALGPGIKGAGLGMAVAVPIAAAIWAVLYFGYVAQRRRSLAAPYFILLWAAAAAGAVTSGAWQAWLEGAAAVRPAATSETLVRISPADAKTAKELDPQTVSKLVDGYFADMRAGAEAYVSALGQAGYLSAVSGETLSTPGGLAAGAERIRAGRETTAKHRQVAIARTDAAIAAVKALPADTPERQFLIEDLSVELADVREMRLEYWDTLSEIADAVEGMSRVLQASQGGWSVDMENRQLVFDTPEDEAAYQAAADRYHALSAQLDSLTARLNRSADALKLMAARWK